MTLYAYIKKKNLKNKDLSTCFKKPEKAAQIRAKKGRKKQFNQTEVNHSLEVQQNIWKDRQNNQ